VLGTTFLYLIGVVATVWLGSLTLAVLGTWKFAGDATRFRAAFLPPVLVSIVVASIASAGSMPKNGLNQWAGWLPCSGTTSPPSVSHQPHGWRCLVIW